MAVVVEAMDPAELVVAALARQLLLGLELLAQQILAAAAAARLVMRQQRAEQADLAWSSSRCQTP